MKVSVVIPNYNGRHLLEKHLPSVFAALRKGDEVIVVDDASTDDSVKYLREKHPKVRVVEHHQNLRFAQSCNDGVVAALNPIIVLLNSDVAPEKDFLSPLLEEFEDERVFAVGCAERDVKGQMSGRSMGRFSRGVIAHWRAKNQEKHTTFWASGGSMAARKDIWEKLGGMDTLFKPAYQEDRDLSYRAMKLGYKVRFAPQSVVFHDHETTNKTALGERTLIMVSFKNLFLFYWKNVTDYDLIIQHFLWLPYHLILGGIRSKGLLIKGFFQALLSIFEVLSKRRMLSKEWKLTDRQVMREVWSEGE